MRRSRDESEFNTFFSQEKPFKTQFFKSLRVNISISLDICIIRIIN